MLSKIVQVTFPAIRVDEVMMSKIDYCHWYRCHKSFYLSLARNTENLKVDNRETRNAVNLNV